MSKSLDIDSLKKSWKEQESSPNKYSQTELLHMLNKRSSNNVKYIVIISCIEFLILMLSLIFTSIDKSEVMQNLDPYAQEVYKRNHQISQILLYSNIIISLIFIFYFYKSYKKINILSSTKDLINNILKFRKSVNLFIFINVTLGMITLFLTGFYDFIYGIRKGISSSFQEPIEFNKIHTPFSLPEYTIGFIVVCLIMILLIIIYYYLIYGVFLRRLKYNLKELRRHEV